MSSIKEWKKETNKNLKENFSVYRVRNNFIFYFLSLYFWITFISIILIIVFGWYFFGEYIFWIKDNYQLIINYAGELI